MLSTSAGDGLVLFKDYKFVLRKFVWIHGLFNQENYLFKCKISGWICKLWRPLQALLRVVFTSIVVI